MQDTKQQRTLQLGDRQVVLVSTSSLLQWKVVVPVAAISLLAAPVLLRSISFPQTFPWRSINLRGAFSSVSQVFAKAQTSDLVLGGAIAVAVSSGISLMHSVISGVGSIILRSTTVTLYLDSKDDAWRWVMEWLAEQSYSRSTTLVSVQTSYRHYGHYIPAGDDQYVNAPRIRFVPAPGIHIVTFKGKWMIFERQRRKRTDTGANANILDELLCIRMFGVSQTAARQLLEEAMRTAQAKDKERTVIYVPDQFGTAWRRNSSRPVRPLDSVVLDEGIAESLAADAKDFIENEKYYAERGMPYRRGYLLYGPPGCGKTSFVTALAGELRLNIYVLNVSTKSIKDENLVELLSSAPDRCILLIEDIDAAVEGESSISFSALLNALDGTRPAHEGRLVFMTTNHCEKLPNALIRPGRADVRQYIGLAKKNQVRRLVQKFYGDESLALALADAVGDDKITMAALSGYLIKYKHRPQDTLANLPSFLAEHQQTEAAK